MTNQTRRKSSEFEGWDKTKIYYFDAVDIEVIDDYTEGQIHLFNYDKKITNTDIHLAALVANNAILNMMGESKWIIKKS